jgi:ribosomal protein S24E
MVLKIKDKKDNGMIGRIECSFVLDYEQAPPTRQQIREELAKEFNIDPGLVVVRKMHNVFGIRRNVGTAHIYNDPVTLKKYVSKYVLVRMGLMTKEEAKPVPVAKPAAAAKK